MPIGPKWYKYGIMIVPGHGFQEWENLGPATIADLIKAFDMPKSPTISIDGNPVPPEDWDNGTFLEENSEIWITGQAKASGAPRGWHVSTPDIVLSLYKCRKKANKINRRIAEIKNG